MYLCEDVHASPRHEDGSERSSEKSVSEESDSSESGIFVSRCVGMVWEDQTFFLSPFKQGEALNSRTWVTTSCFFCERW